MIPGIALLSKVSIESYLGDTATGAGFGPARKLDANVQHASRIVIGDRGETRITEAALVCSPTADVNRLDRITIDDDQLRVQTVTRHRALGTIRFTEVVAK